jgi:hypothetical protein
MASSAHAPTLGRKVSLSPITVPIGKRRFIVNAKDTTSQKVKKRVDGSRQVRPQSGTAAATPNDQRPSTEYTLSKKYPGIEE